MCNVSQLLTKPEEGNKFQNIAKSCFCWRRKPCYHFSHLKTVCIIKRGTAKPVLWTGSAVKWPAMD